MMLAMNTTECGYAKNAQSIANVRINTRNFLPSTYLIKRGIDMATKKDLKNMEVYCTCRHSKYRHLKGKCYGAIRGTCSCKKFKRRD